MSFVLARRFVEALVAGIIAGAVFLVLAPVFIGWRPYTVLTGSMRPGIQPGDVVMDRPVRIADAHVGDVVTFSDPTRGHKLVTHRIRSINRGREMTQVETRGDANNGSERWTIRTRDRVGKVVYVLPKVGYAATLIRNPLGILGLVVLPILLLAGGLIRKIWQDDDEEAAIEAARAEAPSSSEQEPAASPDEPDAQRTVKARSGDHPASEAEPGDQPAVEVESREPMHAAGSAGDR